MWVRKIREPVVVNILAALLVEVDGLLLARDEVCTRR